MSDVSVIVWEVFEQEGRKEAELRLTPEEKNCLVREYGASCEEISAEDANGKRWYLVRMP
ncbi:MAG: hypothetical protein J6K94_01350 [Ruminiclostridium sp.]|nr:hypothetical protein [Ruminiclostridium sp.]